MFFPVRALAGAAPRVGTGSVAAGSATLASGICTHSRMAAGQAPAIAPGAGARVAGAAAGVGMRPSSSVLCDCDRHHTSTPTNKMSATAAEIEYIINCGGILLSSLMAFSATSRGWILGFSGSVLRRMMEGNGSSASGTSVLGAGGAMYTSLSGGNSSISEKLTRLLECPAFSAIIGSTAILGCSVTGSSATADDIFAVGVLVAPSGGFPAEEANWALGSRCCVLVAEESPCAFQPAAAAAALGA